MVAPSGTDIAMFQSLNVTVQPSTATLIAITMPKQSPVAPHAPVATATHAAAPASSLAPASATEPASSPPPVLAMYGAHKAMLRYLSGAAAEALEAAEHFHPLPVLFYNAEYKFSVMSAETRGFVTVTGDKCKAPTSG